MIAAMMLFAVGCGKTDAPTKPDPAVNPSGAEQVEVTLYFSDDQGMYLIPETRMVEADKDDPADLAKAVIEALIADSDTLAATIPEGTRVLSVEVIENVALVDLNAAFKENHWGGTAGEIHTLYSIVNSLAKNVGVVEVQFTIEGEIQESIFGHLETLEPIAPSFDLVKK